MATITYKCPNCGGGLVFDPVSQKFKCEYCASVFTKEMIDKLSADFASDRKSDIEAESAGRASSRIDGSSGGDYSGKDSSGRASGSEDYSREDYSSGDYSSGDYSSGDYSSGDYSSETSAGDAGSGKSGSYGGGQNFAEMGGEGSTHSEHTGGSYTGRRDGARKNESGGAVIYTCPSCGAQIVTDETTAATFCYYCHNPVVLEGKLSGAYLPDRIIPFKYDKKKATDVFLNYVKKKKFVPRAFFNKEQIEKLSGVYYPFWVYDCDVGGNIRSRGQKVRTWIGGDIVYTETSIYHIEREGSVRVQNITRNALNKSDKRLIDAVMPFDLRQATAFAIPYLQGFVAQRRDIENSELEQELRLQARQYAHSALMQTITGYSLVQTESEEYHQERENWQYLLLPVWLLTYQALSGKRYFFAMNGQTGEIHGRLPIAYGKLTLWSGVAGMVAFGIAIALSYFIF